MLTIYLVCILNNVSFAILTNFGMWYSDLAEVNMPLLFLVWQGKNTFEQAFLAEWFQMGVDFKQEGKEILPVISTLLDIYDRLPLVSTAAYQTLWSTWEHSPSCLYYAHEDTLPHVKWSCTKALSPVEYFHITPVGHQVHMDLSLGHSLHHATGTIRTCETTSSSNCNLHTLFCKL